ncbi:hypothetical protein [Pectobacterium carotovorum]|uniref:hypothetical protein n=1 Tax=Pectobacterium carotovorum TaxID=554 RepID=UPI00191EEA76|nr:hypothetical protein [Pectobacterium carotovorum]MBL0908086.1 hypothetical protein [Pectobacterium carotovorum]MCA6968305.1 hypothetical protein [Pectobacterium carotovorum]GKX43042.1 hypothetical protein SOASR015_20760 [Pectobacterium carotovorum subsp. carotovorum]GLX55906.1 hypothetical protein Pcaca02_12150 [Pectobacterium carotovorum subsp. carotovorum]
MEYIESSNRVLARYYDAFIKRTSGIIQETAEDIGTGAARMSVWVSPYSITHLNPNYARAMTEFRSMIFEEDRRMIVCLSSLFINPNLIYDMVKTIIDYLFSKTPDKTQKSLLERYRELGYKVSNTITEQAIKQGTKIALIEGLSRLIASRISNDPEVKLAINKLSKNIITIFQIYGNVEKASRAARKLKRDDRVIYNMLYSQDTEMFYFIIAKKIDPLIVVTKMNDHSNADELINALANIFYDW